MEDKEIKFFTKEVYEEVNEGLGTNFKSDREIDWDILLSSHKLSDEFIERWRFKFNWTWISINLKLSEEFIEKWKDMFIDWRYISSCQILSEQFIEKYQDRVDWIKISENQKLSESFIEKFKDKVSWGYVSFYQRLSESFIERYKDKIDWNCISKSQRLSKEFIKKYKNKINFDLLNKNILVKSDIGRDWFIAYIREGDYNFTKKNLYRFDLFNNYEKEGNLLKVKIYYKDLVFSNCTRKFYPIRSMSASNIKISNK